MDIAVRPCAGSSVCNHYEAHCTASDAKRDDVMVRPDAETFVPSRLRKINSASSTSPSFLRAALAPRVLPREGGIVALNRTVASCCDAAAAPASDSAPAANAAQGTQDGQTADWLIDWLIDWLVGCPVD